MMTPQPPPTGTSPKAGGSGTGEGCLNPLVAAVVAIVTWAGSDAKPEETALEVRLPSRDCQEPEPATPSVHEPPSLTLAGNRSAYVETTCGFKP